MSDSECSKSKRIKLDESLCAEKISDGDKFEADHTKGSETKSISSSTTPVNFLSFSDDVLLLILRNLKPSDLLNVSRCCKRLETISKDFTLWVDVDLSCHALATKDLINYEPFLLPTTKSIRIKGLLNHDSGKTIESNNESDDENLADICTLSPEFLANLSKKCPTLEELSAEYCYINAKEVLIKLFPGSLTSLSLRNSCLINLPNDVSYFSKIDEFLPNLNILDLSYCDWFIPHSLMAISKCSFLEELRLQGCKKMGQCLPYASLASSYGFGSLKKLDLRLTPMGDSEVSCFNKTRSLTHLYLEAPSSESSLTVSDISDRTVTTFGSRGRLLIDPSQIALELIPLLGIHCEDDLHGSRLQVLVLRNFQAVTDLSLRHAAKCMSSLNYLDVTGCSCSPAAITQFKVERPNVVLIHTIFDEEIKTP